MEDTPKASDSYTAAGRFLRAIAVLPIEGYNVDAYGPVVEKVTVVIVTATRRVHALGRRDRAPDTSVVLS